MSRWLWCLAVSIVLAAISPALAAFTGITPGGDRSVVHFWFFGIPELVEGWIAPTRRMRLLMWIVIYLVQYFIVLYLAATAIWEIRRPRGIEATKAFDKAVTRFHGDE